ncbi:MAG TPA: tetratricopeptide repeat protein [Kiritimatiellia bacterium]|nr:tetratricopeptide repeat protein [Kiritimatiellia bacterium]
MLNMVRGSRGLWLAVAVAAWASPAARGEEVSAATGGAELSAALAAMEDGFFREAIPLLEEALREAESRQEQEEVALLLVQAMHAVGEHELVVEWMREHRRLVARPEVESSFVYWHALALYELGRFDAALGELRNFERTYRDQPYVEAAVRLRGLTFERLRRFENAEEDFRRVDRRFPDHPEAPEALLDWARVLDRQGKAEEANRKLEELVERYPDSGAAGMARLYLAQRYFGEEEGRLKAPALLQGVVAFGPRVANPVMAEALLLQAMLHEEGGDEGLAIQTLTRAKGLLPVSTRRFELTTLLVRWMIEAGQTAEADALVLAAIQEDPDHPSAAALQLEAANLLLKQGAVSLAHDAYQRYLETFTRAEGELEASMGKAEALFRLGRFVEAAALYDRIALQAEGEMKDLALLGHAEAYFTNRQFRLAAAAFARAETEAGSREVKRKALRQKAEALDRIGDIEGSEAALRAFAAERPDEEASRLALIRIAELREGRGDWEGALSIFSEYIERHPGSGIAANAVMGRGVLYYRLGRFDEALVDFDRLMEAQAGTAWAEQALFMRAWTLYRQGDARGAVALAEAFLEQHPESVWRGDVEFWLAQHLFNTGDHAGAEAAMADLATRFAGTARAAEAWFWAGQAAALQRRHDAAMAHFNQIVRLHPDSPRVPEARFAQGEVLTDLAEFAGAILAFEDVVLRQPGSLLAARALVRKGDCQFALGADRPERFHEAISTYRLVADDPAVPAGLRFQARVKLGRALEKIGREADAFSAYTEVVYQWLAAREKGEGIPETWFVRAAFHAAALKEAGARTSADDFDAAVSLYERVIASGVPAAEDARLRIQRLREEMITP